MTIHIWLEKTTNQSFVFTNVYKSFEIILIVENGNFVIFTFVGGWDESLRGKMLFLEEGIFLFPIYCTTGSQSSG